MPASTDRRTTHRDPTNLMVFALYLSFAIALTWPLVVRLNTSVPNDLGDPLLNAWILWWNAVNIPFTSAWWNAPAFFPAENVLTFSEHLAGISPISSPIYWLSGNAQLGYNVVFLLTFPLSAFAGYLLCLHLSGRRDAAFLGGLAFGFAPYRVAQFPHLQVLASYWMPIALLGLHRFVSTGGARWLAVFALAWLMQALGNGYYLAFFSVLVVIWIAWFVPWRRWRTALAIGLAWTGAIVLLMPVLLRYRQAHQAFGLQRRFEEIQGYSADVTSLLDASPQLAIWGFLRSLHRAEDELFPGLAVMLLIVLGLIASRRAWTTEGRRQKAEGKSEERADVRRLRNVTAWRRWIRTGLAAVAVLLGGVAASAFIAPWETSIAGIELSANHPEKPLTLSIVCLAVFFATSRPMIAAFRRRSAFAFYVLAAGLMWLMCMGPTPTFLEVPVLATAPYAWLLHLPGWDALRVPARFTMLMILCLATAAGLAYSRFAPSLMGRKRLVLTALFASAILADGWVSEMPLERRPAPWPRGTMRTAGAVLALPLGDPGDDLTAMYRGIWHGRPIVNGYSGNFPSWYMSLRLGLEGHDPSLLDELAALGVTQVVLDSSLDPGGGWDRYVRTRASRMDSGERTGFAVYRLTGTAKSQSGQNLALGSPLPFRAIELSVNPNQVPALTDGDLQTRWETGPQTGAEEMVIDLGASQRVGAVVLSLGQFGADFPRDLQVEVSEDGQTWTEAWRGTCAGPAFVAAVRDPKSVPLTIALGNAPARFIRLRQLAKEPTFYWSVAELSVRGPA